MSHVVHVGFHKTASTWLQKHVFPNAEDFTYPTGPIAYHLLGNITEADYHPKTVKAFFEEAGDRVLLSSEALAGSPWGSGVSPDVRVERLAELVPHATILIVRRDVESWKRSLYVQWILEGGYGSMGDFEEWFDPSYLDADAAVSRFESAFADVHVFDYADLADPESFVEQLGKAADTRFTISAHTRENPSLTGWRLRVLRTWNKAFRETPHNPEPWLPLPGAAVVRHMLQG